MEYDNDLDDEFEEEELEPYCLCGKSCTDCDGDCEDCDCEEQQYTEFEF